MWDAICWSQFADVARWTWSHNSGRPTGNIWPLSSSVATTLTSEKFMRDPKIADSRSAESSPLVLPRRAPARPIGAEDAAVPRLRSKNPSTSKTLIEVHTGIGWHLFGRLVPAVRASDYGGQNHHGSLVVRLIRCQTGRPHESADRSPADGNAVDTSLLRAFSCFHVRSTNSPARNPATFGVQSDLWAHSGTKPSRPSRLRFLAGGRVFLSHVS